MAKLKAIKDTYVETSTFTACKR